MYRYQYAQPTYNADYLKDLVMQKLFNGLAIASFISFFVVFYGVPVIFILLAFVGELIAIIGYFFARNENTIEKLYYLFVVSTAILLGFFLSFIGTYYIDGYLIIFNAVSITAIVVGGMYYYTSTKRPDVSGMGRILMPLSLVFIIILIAGIFISFSNVTIFFISIFGAILFSLYLFYDLGRVMRGQYSSPARMAWNVYWDILLVFKYILRILLAFARER